MATVTFAVLALSAASTLAALEVGCGGGESTLTKAKLPEGMRSQAIEHEACTESGHRVETVDVHNDKKADIRRVFDGQREVCRISDLNRDGKPDMFEYYDQAGVLRRREADYDDNGIINAVEIYENGKLVRAELDTTNHGRIDTWDTFDPSTGKRIRRERDVTGDGKVDQWWTFDGDKVSITTDRNGDGKPDPDSTVTMGGPPPAPPGPPAAVDAGAAPAAVASGSSSAGAGGTGPLVPTAAVADAGPPKRGGAKR